MGELLRAYAVATLSGLAILPMVRGACVRLPDRGLGISRILGLAAAAWMSFLVAGAAGTPLGAPIALGTLAVLGSVAWGGAAWRTARAPRAAAPRPPAGGQGGAAAAILGVEAVTLAGLILFYLVARHNPTVDPDSERFMDYAFLKAYLRSPGLPVGDPWLAGQPIDYYHFGYALLAFLLRAAGLDPATGLVPAIAVLDALVWGAACSAGLALTGRLRGGCLAAFLVLGAGNLEWIRQVRAVAAGRPFDWFASSRVISGTIEEFPWFSLLWGDPHPYVVALPIFLGAVTLLLAAAPGAAADGAMPRGGAAGRRPGWLPLAACLAIASGSLLATHPWDLPVLILAAGAIGLAGGRHGMSRGAGALAVGIAAGAAAYAPFLRGVRQGGRVLALVQDRSRPGEWALAFGPFLLLALCGAVVLGAERLVAAGRGSGGGPPRGVPGAALGLGAAGLLAALACEVVYVRDFFASSDLARMNTVFKVHRLAWALFGIAAPVLVARLGGHGGCWRHAGRAVIALFLAGAGVYPVLGTRAWLSFRSGLAREARAGGAEEAAAPGAPADALFRALYPGDAAAADYLARHAAPGDVVLEETGEPYTWSSRIATFSGVPAILGWGNHEAGWHDDWAPVLKRQREIESIYRDPASDAARALVRARRVRWAVVGARERARYGSDGPARLAGVGEPVLDQDGTALYRLDGTAPP